MTALFRATFAALLATAVFIPFAAIAGPLSSDDVFPLMAVAIGLALMPFASKGSNPLDATIIGFVAICVFALMSSAANAETIGDFGRLAGRSAGRMMFYLALIVGARVLLHEPKWAHRAVWMFAAAATLQALFCIWAFRAGYQGPYGIGIADIPQWSVLSGHTRVHGTFSGQLKSHEGTNVSANFLASYLVMTVPTTLGLALYERRKLVRLPLLLGAAAQVLALYLTYTRAALVALGFAVLVMGWLLGRRKLAIAAVVLAVVATASIPTMRAKFLKEGHNRYALWWASTQTTAQHPLLGVGDGNYMRVLAANPRIHETPWGVANATAHNSILLATANHGLGGGLAFLLLDLLIIGAAIDYVRRSKGRARLLTAALAASIAGYMIQDQFNNLSFVPKVATQMWFLFALMPLLCRMKDPPDRVALKPVRAPRQSPYSVTY